MPINVFTVVSEFKFDVAGAVLGVDTLQNKVDGLSRAAGGALDSLSAIGMGFVASFSGATGGLLGLMGNALSVSDKFTQSQLSFVQIIDSNMAHLSGTVNGINEQMLTSRSIMDDIAKDANKFGLPAQSLLNMTKTLSAMLVPKGLAGENFSGARTMSRNLMKSAPNLGIDPGMVQGQLLRSIEGAASMGDTLFRRLISEAPESFKQANVKDAKGFNALKAAERFNILNDSLAKFANNSEILEMRANTLAGTMQTVRDLFGSFNSVLKPLGDVLLPILIDTIQIGIDYLNTHGRDIIESMAVFMKTFVAGPKEMIIDLMSLQQLSSNVAKSAGFVGLIVGLTHFQAILTGLAGVPILGAIAGVLGGVFNFLLKIPLLGGAIKGFMGVFSVGEATGFLGLLKVIGITMFRMAGMFGILLIPLQGLSRAMARMKMDSMVWLMENTSVFIDMLTDLRLSFSKVMAPITDMITGWEELFYTIFSGNGILTFMRDTLGGIVSGIGFFADTLNTWYAGFKGLIGGVFGLISQHILNILQIIENIKSGNFSGLLDGTENIFGEFMSNGAAEFMKTINQYRTPTLSPEGVDNASVVNSVNNYDVTMNNSFKEVLQPDRIAFTIQDQLEKASVNRRTTAPNSIGAQHARSI